MKFIEYKRGISYPEPLVDNVLSTQLAKDRIWSVKKTNKAKELSKIIIQKHASNKNNF